MNDRFVKAFDEYQHGFLRELRLIVKLCLESLLSSPDLELGELLLCFYCSNDLIQGTGL